MGSIGDEVLKAIEEEQKRIAAVEMLATAMASYAKALEAKGLPPRLIEALVVGFQESVLPRPEDLVAARRNPSSE